MLSRRSLLIAGVGALATFGCRNDAGAPGEAQAPGSSRVSIPRRTLEEQIEQFLSDPEINGAALLAIAMGETGDVGWVPYLIDLLRLAGDELGAGQIMGALQRLTGRYVLDDAAVAFVEYGGWMLREAPQPAPGYHHWKSTLYQRIDPSFATMLAGIDDPVLLSEIQWGGVVRGGIPQLEQPGRVSAAATEVRYLTDDEFVFGLTHRGSMVAYPERILGYHELANDIVAGDAVIVSYCPLCRSARAYLAEGRSMQTSGLLRNSNKLMVQQDDDALWQQLNGQALSGAQRGQTLAALDVETMTWREWRNLHADTEVLVRPDPAQFPTTSYSYEPFESYRGYDADSGAWFPVLQTPGTIPLKATVEGVSAAGASLAVDIAALARSGPTFIAWPDSPTSTVLAVPTESGARIYDASSAPAAARAGISAPAAARAGISAPAAARAGISAPAAAGAGISVSRSDRTEALLSDGTTLPLLASDRSIWFAWYGEHRDTAWWPQ